jgi:hypothetical protein
MNLVAEDSLRIIYQYDSTYHIHYQKILHNIKYVKPLSKIKYIYYEFSGEKRTNNVRLTFVNVFSFEFIQFMSSIYSM